MKAGLEIALHHVVNNCIDRVIDALDHARQHVTGLYHVLIGINSDNEMRGAPVYFASLLDCIEGAQTRIAGGSEDYIGAFADLRKRKLLSFAWIVPGAIGYADIVLDHLDIWIH